jgi:hypothetical protein
VNVELEQLRAAGERGDFLDRMGGEAGDAEPDAELCRRPGDRPLAVLVEGALRRPMIVQPASISPTPASTSGTRSTSSKALVLRVLVISSSAAPSM